MNELISRLEKRFIVSCQALEDEPLHSPDMMAAMASAAEEGGAAGIRANSPQDIAMIKTRCSLPVIGLYKKHYPDSSIYITPTMKEVEEVVAAGADLVAIDATRMRRPGGASLEEAVRRIRERFPETPIVGDVSTFEEGVAAMELGIDLISTTLSGYTPYSKQQADPDIELVASLAALGRTPVIAEGRIWTVEQCLQCYDVGAYAVVVGTAITRPREITRRFVEAIAEKHRRNDSVS